MKYYSAVQRNEILNLLQHGLEDVMWSEIGQTQKDKYRRITFTRGSWDGQLHGQNVDGGRRKERLLFPAYELSIWPDKNVLVQCP